MGRLCIVITNADTGFRLSAMRRYQVSVYLTNSIYDMLTVTGISYQQATHLLQDILTGSITVDRPLKVSLIQYMSITNAVQLNDRG